jgi:hypothetical protein
MERRLVTVNGSSTSGTPSWTMSISGITVAGPVMATSRRTTMLSAARAQRSTGVKNYSRARALETVLPETGMIRVTPAEREIMRGSPSRNTVRCTAVPVRSALLPTSDSLSLHIGSV